MDALGLLHVVLATGAHVNDSKAGLEPLEKYKALQQIALAYAGMFFNSIK